MSGTAPYEVTITGSDDETFAFTIPWEKTDGTSFPFDSYKIEYSLTRGGSQVLYLTEGAGISVNDPEVTFRKIDGGSLQCGEYEHGCRIRDLMTGNTIQVFDGPVIIGEGNFR